MLHQKSLRWRRADVRDRGHSTDGAMGAAIDYSRAATVRKVAVLYTTYLPLPTNAWYNSWIAPFADQIAAKMQSCASPGLYFEVGPNQGISEAMNAFQKAVAMARLTK
jgi:hypothetical protein